MNNDNSLSGVIVGAVVVVAIIGGLFWYNDYKKTQEEEKNGGALYIGFTDATTDINNVNEVNMEVKKVEVHSATNGWVTASSDTKKYDLLKLHAEGKTELYAKARVPAGSYDRVRVTLGDTVVKTKNSGDVKAYTPSSQVVFNMAVKVASTNNSHLQLDVLADKSLHATTDGKYVFAPVVKAKSQSNATVTVSNDDAVVATGGTVDSSVSVGVDLSGSSRSDFNLDTQSGLKIDTSVVGPVKFILGGKTYTETKTDQEQSFKANGDVNVDVSSNKKDDSGSASANMKGALDISY